jgi:hypothetical protein
MQFSSATELSLSPRRPDARNLGSSFIDNSAVTGHESFNHKFVMASPDPVLSLEWGQGEASRRLA